MVATIMICSGVGVYILASFVVLLFATYFELPIWVEYVLCVVCFPWVVAWYLGHLVNSTFHCYDDEEDD